MDNRAAVQYLDRVFATGKGYVAVAYKDKDESWQESQFAWPSERPKLMGWVKVHQDANVFICPALRADAHTRRKQDGVNLRWLWADVDWDKVPADKHPEVKARINDISTMVVSSGSGDNAHVYVDLGTTVDVAEHYRLNTGLRDYLYADAKHADNSLLRLPGTTNWKTQAGSAVKIRPARNKGRTTPPAKLNQIKAFKDVKVSALVGAVAEWTVSEVDGLPRRIRAMTQMPTAEAVAKYGKRHKAVWAITGELHKRGLDVDQIHTLMDTFPAAVEKNAEEHNGYDVHKDVDKRLIWDRANTPGLMDDDMDEDAGELFEAMTPEQVMDSMVAEGVEKELLRRDIRKAADRAEAERGWTGPPDDVSWSLTDGLNNPPQPIPHLIQGLAGAKHNVVITAQYKTGKTAFTMGSLASALCDGEDFLDQFPVTVEGGTIVGHWNCEMDPHEMLDDYIRPVGIQNTDNLHVANLRGHRVNILTTMGRQWAINWLITRDVKVWTIDSFARLARMAGVSEKDNDEVMSLLMALDEIKVEAGVDVIFLITHTGRAEMEEGKERARGATAIDDWADARWIITKMDKARFLRVEGRGVALDDSALVFNEDTKRSVLGFGGKNEVREDTVKDAVVKIVSQQPGINKTELLRALKAIKVSNRAAAEPIEEAIEGNFIEVREEMRRGKPAQCHYLTQSSKGETRAHRATPANVDMRRTARRTRSRVSDL